MVRASSCAPSTIGFRIFSSGSVPGFPAPITTDRTKSHVTAPPVPVNVNDEATGRARRADREAANEVAGAEHGLKVGRSGVDPGNIDRAGRGGEALQRGNQRIQRVRQDVHQLPRERSGAAAFGRRAGGTKREVTVDLHGRPEIAGSCDERLERAVAEQLVPRADEQAPRTCQVEQPRRVADRQGKRLLDVDVRAALEGRGRGLAMRAGWRADVHDIRACVLEQGRDRAICRGSGERGELLGRAGRPIVNANHGDGNRELPERAQVMAGHPARPDECHAKRH